MRRGEEGRVAGERDPVDPRRPAADEGGETAESRQTLWLLAASPTIWAGHFLACYLTAAIWCAKAGVQAGSIGWVPAAVSAYTAVALAAIGVVGAIGWRRHDYGTAAVPHDFDTREDCHRFMGFATVLLSGLSAVAVLYVAMAALFFGTCR